MRILLLAFTLAAGTTACLTPDSGAAATVPLSFDVLVAALPADCCPTCTGIRLTVRNISDAPVVVDWDASSMHFNGDKVRLPVDGAMDAAMNGAMDAAGPRASTIARSSEWSGLLRPMPGAPNPTSLEEGKLRNGRYHLELAVKAAGRWARASTSVDVTYEQTDATSTPVCMAPAR